MGHDRPCRSHRQLADASPAADPDCRPYGGSEGLTITDKQRALFRQWNPIMKEWELLHTWAPGMERTEFTEGKAQSHPISEVFQQDQPRRELQSFTGVLPVQAVQKTVSLT